MTFIEVLAPGLFSTVQDRGREGHGRLGISPAGAADTIALRLANRLAGNDDGAAAIEMTLLGGAFRFEGDVLIALAGCDLGATLDGDALAPWTSRTARARQTLRCGVARSGARAYLAVQGGITVPSILGSASTHVPSGLGGLEGRVLRAGDRLPVGEVRPPTAPRRVNPTLLAGLAPRRTLRVTQGPQAERFAPEAWDLLMRTAYTVKEDSDRMGLRLRGARMAQAPSGGMVTQGVPPGAVQVPPGGEPIILFVDQQTTGGYPVIASVISADLTSVAQLRPRDEVRFQAVPLAEARALFLEQEARLRSPDLFLT